MSLLRASSFCQRRSEREHSVRVVGIVRPLGCRCENDWAAHAEPCLTTASRALLKDASLRHGQLAWVDSRKTRRRILVQVLLDRKDLRREGETDAASDAWKNPPMDPNESVPTVRLSAIAAVNLGLSLTALDWESRDNDIMAGLTPCRTVPRAAASIGLRVLARPCHFFQRKTQQSQRNQGAESEPCEKEDDWPLPKVGTVVQPDTVLCVQRATSCTRDGPHDDADENWVYYHVTTIHGVGGSNDSDIPLPLYKTTTSTKYSLELPPFSFGPRLPPLVPLVLDSPHIPPHPNLSELLRCVDMDFTVSRAAECVWHVVGTERDHHLSVGVAATAIKSGRRLVTLARGWAAYAYQSHGSIVSRGGLVDKLRGLEAAIVHAKQCVPALLHVCFDVHEFSGTSGGDPGQFWDEQSRIWSLIMTHLNLTESDSVYSGDSEGDGRLVPPLVVVISTAAPLPPGPLLENLVFEPIHASLPDAAYIRYIWREAVGAECSAAMLAVLKGRSAADIGTLKDEYMELVVNATNEHMNDPENGVSMLKELASELDRRRRSGLARIPQVQWSDVGGLASVRREILDTIELPLQHPHLFSGRRSGILLYGPPGTGKTLVAKAVATECNVPFLSVKGPELLGSFVGESEENVRNVFAQARKLAQDNPRRACILFFDELDSLAPSRSGPSSGGSGGGGSVMDRLVATLFSEFDRNESHATVYCLGATNRPDLLDAALLRPGRFDRLVYLGMASPAEQASILAAQMRKLKLERDALEMAQLVSGELPANLSGADLSTIVSQALLRATERLCNDADEELARKGKGDALQSDAYAIDQVLASWDEERLRPVVTLEDLRWASRQVVPSVSEDELKGYERLRNQFQQSPPGDYRR